MSLVRMNRKDLKPLTRADRERLRRAKQKPIDFSDIPELSDDWINQARRAVDAATQSKSQVALRLDDDVVDWFRGQGAGYQTRMNAVLRSYMEASVDRAKGI